VIALESAVEVVVRWLADHGHEDLAAQVSVATDPRTPEERRELASAVAAILGTAPRDE
jgi:hypothetical protein